MGAGGSGAQVSAAGGFAWENILAGRNLQFVVLLGICFLAAAVSGGQANVDKDLDRAIAWIEAHQQVPAKNLYAVTQDLEDAAQDPEKGTAIRFCGTALYLLGQGKGDFLRLLMEDKGDGIAWKGLAELGREYAGDGGLPAVRYSIGAKPAPGWTDDLNRKFQNEVATVDVRSQYYEYRDSGLSPDKAWQKLTKNAKEGSYVQIACDLIAKQLTGIGCWCLTGYSEDEADDDVPIFLESCYACVNPKGADKTVRPAGTPSEFIAEKLELALKLDLAHVMRPVAKIIDDAIYAPQPPKPPTRPIASAPAVSGMPPLDKMGLPGKPSEVLAFDNSQPITYGFGYRSFNFFERVNRPDGEIVDKHRTDGAPTGSRGGCWEIRTVRSADGQTIYLKPNRTYDLILYPWAWASQPNSVFFAPGSMTVTPYDQIQNPPAASRVWLPASAGQGFEIHLQVCTDVGGRFRLLFFQPGDSALSLGAIYVRL